MPPPSFRPGFITRRQSDALNEMADQQSGLLESGQVLGGGRWGGPDGQYYDDPGAQPERSFWAEITGSAAAATTTSGSEVDADELAYSWTERIQNRAGVWIDGERSGEENAYLAEPSAGDASTVANGTLVRMWPSPTADDAWEFKPAGAAGVDYQNTTAADVGTRTINEADNTTGIYNETASTPTRNVQKLYAATKTQTGTVTTSYQQIKGQKVLYVNPTSTNGGHYRDFFQLDADVPGYYSVASFPTFLLDSSAALSNSYAPAGTAFSAYVGGYPCMEISPVPTQGGFGAGGLTLIAGVASGVPPYTGLVIAGSVLNNQPGTYAVLRVVTSLPQLHIGIDRNFAVGESPNVVGGIVVGYSSSSSISNLQSAMTAAQSDITTAQSDITTAQGDISTLQGYFSGAVSGNSGGITATNGVVTAIGSPDTVSAAVSGTAGASYTSTEQAIIDDLVTLVNELRAALVARNIVA